MTFIYDSILVRHEQPRWFCSGSDDDDDVRLVQASINVINRRVRFRSCMSSVGTSSKKITSNAPAKHRNPRRPCCLHRARQGNHAALAFRSALGAFTNLPDAVFNSTFTIRGALPMSSLGLIPAYLIAVLQMNGADSEVLPIANL